MSSERPEDRRQELLWELLQHDLRSNVDADEADSAQTRSPEIFEAMALAASDPEVAAELEGMKRVADFLDAGGNLERKILAETKGAASPTEVDFVLKALESKMSPAAPPMTPSLVPRRPVLVAALLFIVAGVSWSILRDGEGPNSLPTRQGELGPSPIQLVTPEIEHAGEFKKFIWDAPGLEEGTTFSLRIVSSDPSTLGEELEYIRGLTKSSWYPDPDDVHPWPIRITWTVTPVSPGGGRGPAATGYSTRSE